MEVLLRIRSPSLRYPVITYLRRSSWKSTFSRCHSTSIPERGFNMQLCSSFLILDANGHSVPYSVFYLNDLDFQFTDSRMIDSLYCACTASKTSTRLDISCSCNKHGTNDNR
ncbi:hypothetical protein WA171_005241, partial [Blastocystis sp. BT1]